MQSGWVRFFNFLSGKYDALRNQLKDINRKVNSHASDAAKVKENLKEIEKKLQYKNRPNDLARHAFVSLDISLSPRF